MGCCGSDENDLQGQAFASGQLPGAEVGQVQAQCPTHAFLLTPGPQSNERACYVSRYDVASQTVVADGVTRRDLGEDLVAAMRRQHEKSGDRLCVVLIDMANPKHFDEKYDGARTVGDAQIAVLQEANNLGITDFNVTTGSEPTQHALAQYFDDNKVDIAKGSGNVFSSKPFVTAIEERGIECAVVMGFDADICVKASIFGEAGVFLPGFLGRGIPVLTSRAVLSTGNDTPTLSFTYRAS